LRAWAGRQESDPPATTGPPDGSWIKVEGEPGAWRLSWEPPATPWARTCQRWSAIGALVAWLLVWLTVTTFFKVFCGGAIVQQAAGGGWLAWVRPALPALCATARML